MDYDYLTAALEGMKAQKVKGKKKYDWQKGELAPLDEYHWSTRVPKSGKILKETEHPTLLMGLLKDMGLGYNPYVDPEGELYTLDEDEYLRKALVDYIRLGRRK